MYPFKIHWKLVIALLIIAGIARCVERANEVNASEQQPILSSDLTENSVLETATFFCRIR